MLGYNISNRLKSLFLTTLCSEMNLWLMDCLKKTGTNLQITFSVSIMDSVCLVEDFWDRRKKFVRYLLGCRLHYKNSTVKFLIQSGLPKNVWISIGRGLHTRKILFEFLIRRGHSYQKCTFRISGKEITPPPEEYFEISYRKRTFLSKRIFLDFW